MNVSSYFICPIPCFLCSFNIQDPATALMITIPAKPYIVIWILSGATNIGVISAKSPQQNLEKPLMNPCIEALDDTGNDSCVHTL